jgi:3-deoxy-D-manno-octulosonic-acid transferase
MSLGLGSYRLATTLLEPFAPLVLGGRVRRGKEDPLRLAERLGRPGLPRPAGPLAWLHGASVGESLSLLPLAERLKAARPDLNLLITSGTVTAAEILAQRVAPGVIHQYVPIDAPGAARRFIAHWRPDLALFVESELWPNLLLAAKAGGAKLALVSARLGEDSAGGWAKAKGAARKLLGAFDLILPQDDIAAQRLSGLGARDDGRLNLKLAGEPLPADPADLASLQVALADRPVLLAASTHPGEDEIVLDAFLRLRERSDRPLLVLVPRHPVRGPAVLDAARARGFETTRRGAGEAPGEAEVYVADTLGELGLWFRLCRAALIGGSLVPGIGGHNPLEAARLDRPAISGSAVEGWRSIYGALLAERGVVIADDAEALARAFAELIDNPAEAGALAARARAVADHGAQDLDSAATRVQALLP